MGPVTVAPLMPSPEQVRPAPDRLNALMRLVASLAEVHRADAVAEHFDAAWNYLYGDRAYLQISTRRLTDGEFRVERALPADLLFSRATDSRLRGGILGQIITAGEPRCVDLLEMTADDPLISLLDRYRSAVAVPVFVEAEPPDWAVMLDPRPCAFDAAAMEELLVRANLLGLATSKLRTAERLAQANSELAEAIEWIDREISQIAKIQKSMLPDPMPTIPGLRLAWSYDTFDRAGGDLFDVLDLSQPPSMTVRATQTCPSERWAIVVADASGHGPAAAVVTAMFHAILHTYPTCPAGPGVLLEHANRHLCAKRIQQSFVTALMVFYEPGTRRLTYARAGHPPALLKSFPQTAPGVLLDAVGEIPLGIDPRIKYHDGEVVLQPGQTLMLYTDGITEARTAQGQMFGIEGIEQSLSTCTGEADCAVNHIVSALRRHQMGVRPQDDQTVVAIKVAEILQAGP